MHSGGDLLNCAKSLLLRGGDGYMVKALLILQCAKQCMSGVWGCKGLGQGHRLADEACAYDSWILCFC